MFGMEKYSLILSLFMASLPVFDCNYCMSLAAKNQGFINLIRVKKRRPRDFRGRLYRYVFIAYLPWGRVRLLMAMFPKRFITCGARLGTSLS